MTLEAGNIMISYIYMGIQRITFLKWTIFNSAPIIKPWQAASRKHNLNQPIIDISLFRQSLLKISSCEFTFFSTKLQKGKTGC